VHPIQQRRDVTHELIRGHESRKGAHVLEPAHGDIILKRRTSSQKTVNDEDYSVTQISSMALSTSQSHRHHHHHRTSASRSRHRRDTAYDKHTPSTNENLSHKQKETTTSSVKSSTRRRWLKGRKETPIETPIQGTKQEIPSTKSNKNHKNKNKNTEQEKSDAKKASNSINKEKSSSDNNRVYGVPNTNGNEQIKTASPSKIEEECQSDNINHPNTNMSPKEEDMNQSKGCDTPIQRRTNKKHHQQKLSSTDGDILSKIDEDTQFVFYHIFICLKYFFISFTDFLVLLVIMFILPSTIMTVKVMMKSSLKIHLLNPHQLLLVINQLSILQIMKHVVFNNNHQILFDVMQVNLQLMN
jgi:hypothetical protein